MTAETLNAQRIAIDVEGDTVRIELGCSDAYAAQVLADDLRDRLVSDHLLHLIVQVAPVAAPGPSR